MALTTKQVLVNYKISSFTLRNWRRGWYTDENGQHFFFPDKAHLAHSWNEKKRRFEYKASDVRAWHKKLKAKISIVRAEAARERGRKNRAKKGGGK